MPSAKLVVKFPWTLNQVYKAVLCVAGPYLCNALPFFLSLWNFWTAHLLPLYFSYLLPLSAEFVYSHQCYRQLHPYVCIIKYMNRSEYCKVWNKGGGFAFSLLLIVDRNKQSWKSLPKHHWLDWYHLQLKWQHKFFKFKRVLYIQDNSSNFACALLRWLWLRHSTTEPEYPGSITTAVVSFRSRQNARRPCTERYQCTLKNHRWP